MSSVSMFTACVFCPQITLCLCSEHKKTQVPLGKNDNSYVGIWFEFVCHIHDFNLEEQTPKKLNPFLFRLKNSNIEWRWWARAICWMLKKIRRSISSPYGIRPLAWTKTNPYGELVCDAVAGGQIRHSRIRYGDYRRHRICADIPICQNKRSIGRARKRSVFVWSDSETNASSLRGI